MVYKTFELDTKGVDKYSRLSAELGKIESGFVFIPENATWVATFLQECENFRADMKHIPLDNEPIGHDDQVDILSYGLSDKCNKVIIDYKRMLNAFTK